MSSIFAILFVAAINLMPGGIGEFSFTMPESNPLQFTQQVDGGWKGVKAGTQESPLFYVKGTELTMKGSEKEFTSDLAPTLGVTKDTKWDELKELKVGTQVIGIERRADGLDFVVKIKKDDKEVERRFLVRWSADAKPK